MDKFRSFNPVAVRLGQHYVHAPAHDTWCTVTCHRCGAAFAVGPNRNLGSRRSPDDCVKQVEDILTTEREVGNVHLVTSWAWTRARVQQKTTGYYSYLPRSSDLPEHASNSA